MFRHIMTPVDLGHLDKLRRSLDAVAAMAAQTGAKVTFVSVTGNAPGPHGATPEDFKMKLAGFAAKEATAQDYEVDIHVIVAHDPSHDIDAKLRDAVEEIGADLVIMASHAPGVADYFWPSHGGALASHTKASVLLVRDA
jgi:nucleotide-binding universal stress UspA family protein